MVQYLTVPMMQHMWPRGNSVVPQLIEGIVWSHEATFAKYGLNNKTVIAHFMAQLSHECGGGTEVIESLNYTTPQRIVKVWPKRFNLASAALYIRNPRKLANKVYNGRMGNQVGTDDGWNFRGRGGVQTTGREGYERLSKRTGLDLVGHPEYLINPRYFLECAVADFILCGCLPFAQRDDVRGVTQKLNGGQTNIADRIDWLARWKAVLKPPLPRPAPTLEPEEIPEIDDTPQQEEHTGILKYGDEGYEVKALQERLRDLGYSVGKVDTKFGSATRAAVLAFQADNGLHTDGIVGDETKEALKSDTPKPLNEERVNVTAADLREQGSETVKTADKVGFVGKVAAALGIGGAANETGGLQTVKDTVDQVQSLQPIADAAQSILTWLGHHWWLWVLLAGFGIYYWTHKIIDRRVADHANGANLGR